ncbi:MAG TPA: LamG-like jellyroll fold domain-containing protein [Verrucomicrobiae bacterium]|nr:LamG-like jellyroll fold domain-containing protein [Verrucomicrobiae bacterium]
MATAIIVSASIFLCAVVQNARAASVTFEAENGALGSDFTNGTDGAVQYISISTDTVNTGNPGNANRMASYTVTFPAAGTYNLYARILVGPGGFNDDSLFYANGFGTKSPTADGDWLTVNGLASGGDALSAEVVTNNGTAGTGIWKWVNLSQFNPSNSGTETPIKFTVGAGNLTQTFQIGARENGLEIDKFVFGTADYIFTVSDLDNETDGTEPPPPPPLSITVDATKTYQTIEGLGGAIAFYNGWVTAHPYKLEIYTNAFAGLNLSMLRLGNWFRYQGTSNFDPDAPDFVSNANRILGHPVPVYMSSWAPPAFLKSNGQVGNGGTLIYTNGSFAYTNFAQYWYDSLLAYRAQGVSPTWISIQNEPDFAASYDSCVFHPTEDTVKGTNYASYSKALDAVFQRLTDLPSPPKILGPEVVGLGFNDVQNYAATMNANSFYGLAHHLYGGSSDGTPDGYNANLSALTNVFPSKPRFMTEYGVSDMIEQANLIHNVLAVEQASGYNYWSLIWPVGGNGLVQIENPFNRSSWTNAPPGTTTQSHGWWLTPAYWAMKHYSYFIQPGFKRVSATCNNAHILVSAYLSPDDLRLVAVFINRDSGQATADVNFGSFPFFHSSIYQTADTNHFQPLGPVSSQLNLPALSLTTVVLDKLVAVGQANSPFPTNGTAPAAFNATMSWTPGSNAVTHALYLGIDSNSVAQATPASSEFMGILSTNAFAPALSGNTTYFWRVDEIAGENTNVGDVWSFRTGPTPALRHRYSFSETNGATVSDAVSGPAWNGALPKGGTFSGGQLTLASGSSQYVGLPAGIVGALTNFTIEAWVKLNSTADWARIFDFGNDTTSYMFLTPQNGSTSRVRFAITANGPGGEQQINCNSSMAVGTWYHVAVTHNGNEGILYLNGVSVGTNSSMTLKPSDLGDTANNYLGRSQFSSDAYLNARLDEFRIYSIALSANEIAATYALGPDEILSTNSPAITFSITSSNLTLTWPLASAGYTLESSTNLTSWMKVTSAPRIIGGQWQVDFPESSGAGMTFYRLVK